MRSMPRGRATIHHAASVDGRRISTPSAYGPATRSKSTSGVKSTMAAAMRFQGKPLKRNVRAYSIAHHASGTRSQRPKLAPGSMRRTTAPKRPP